MENMELKGKNILVTGGMGFVGSHLSEELVKSGARVIIPYQSVIPYSYFHSATLDKKCILLPIDITLQSSLFDALVKYEVDVVFHLAAQPIVTTAYANPARTIEINVMGTVNVLEAARIWGKCQAIIVASSDKAYGKLSKESYVETDALMGNHPYDVSKSAADLIASSYYKTYKLPVVITRFGNIYGEGDLNFSRIIPGIIQSLINNQILNIRSDGKYIRNYVYVKDVVTGYLLALDSIDKIKGEAFNLSSYEKYSILELISLIEKILKKKVRYQIQNIAQNEIPYQMLNDNKARKILGYNNKSKIETTIERIYNWYNLLNNAILLHKK